MNGSFFLLLIWCKINKLFYFVKDCCLIYYELFYLGA